MGNRELRRLARIGKQITVAGKEYTLSPLQLSHLAQLEEWAEDEPYRRLKRKLDMAREAGASQSALDAIVASAEKESTDVYSRGSMMESVAGAMKSIRLSLSVAHPNLKEDEFQKIISDIGVDQLKSLVDDVSDLSADEAKNSGSGAAK